MNNQEKYQKKKDSVLQKIVQPLNNNFKILNALSLKLTSCGFGGRDDDYVGVHFKNENSKIELTITFWINLYDFKEETISITYSCFKKDKSKITTFFNDRVILNDLDGNSYNEKIIRLLKDINGAYTSSITTEK